MPENFSNDRLKMMLFFPFADPDWPKKLGIAALLIFASFIIPIVPLIFVIGYSLQVMRKVITGNGIPALPEWDDWGRYFSEGLRAFGIVFIFSLPALLFMFLGYGISMLATFLVPLMSFPSEDSYLILPQILLTFSSFGWMFFIGIGILLSLFTSIFTPPAIGHMVAKESFKAAFSVKKWLRVFKNNIKDFLLAYLLLWGLYMVFMLITQVLYLSVLLCCLLPFISAAISAYLSIVSFGLIGMAYRGDGTPGLPNSGEPQPDFIGETENVAARKFKMEDLEEFLEYRNHPRVNRFHPWDEFTKQDGREFIQSRMNMRMGQVGKWYAVCLIEKATGKIVGEVGYKIDPENPKQAEVGIMLVPEYQAKELTIEIIYTTLEYLFNHLKMHRFYGRMEVKNMPAWRIFETIGGRREGHHIEYAFYKGKWKDFYVYAMLDREWEEAKKKFPDYQYTAYIKPSEQD